MAPASYLRKRIVWLLAIKLVALVVIRQLFFGGEHRVEMGAQQVRIACLLKIESCLIGSKESDDAGY